ncbi:MAG: hypothetical protein AB1801_28220, partial [Chloroflexota bacterium]
MFNSLTVKLTLAFLAVSLIGVALVAIFSRLITEREFDRFRQEQARSDFITQVTAYYQTHGSWQGINQVFYQPDQSPPPPGQPAGPPFLQPRFALVNQDNIVVLADGPYGYGLGDRPPPDVLRQGAPLEIDGQRVGTILTNNARTTRDPL